MKDLITIATIILHIKTNNKKKKNVYSNIVLIEKGTKVSNIKSPSTTELLYSKKDFGGKKAVAFVDGHAEMVEKK